MRIGEKCFVAGYVTQWKSLAGRPLRLIESFLGFHAGRLAAGADFLFLDRLPGLNEFETAGYSQVAAHRHQPLADFDQLGLRRLAMSVWTPTGPNRLIKVKPIIQHDAAMNDDQQYPPGQGVPQWKLIAPISAIVIASLRNYDDLFAIET